MARDPAFREAVAWQSRESLARAVDKLAAGAPGSPSRRRRWPDVVASYWQRYCSKNDTIGFFGPLAWGSFGEQGEAIAVRSGALERERVVHFETWAMEAVAAAAGVTTPLPMGPFPERALPADTSGLDRLEAARDAVAAARREDVAAALDQLDRVFEEVTGRPATRAEGDSGGGRTVAYLDCMRDLDVTLGPARARRAAHLAAAGARTRRAGGAGACSTAAPSCWAASPTGAPARSRRCSAS